MTNVQPGWRVAAHLDIRFGAGGLEQLGEVVGGRRALVVCTPGAAERGLAARVETAAGSAVAVDATVRPNPDIDDLDRQAGRLAGLGAEVLVAVGGGSVMDSAKALSVLLGDHDADLSSHLRDGRPLGLRRAVPIVAVPTTAGTGAEVTPFAALWDRTAGRKHSLNDDRLTPETAIVDPELTLGLPPADTVASGLDAVSQALESLWSRAAHPVSRAYAGRSLRTSLSALPAVVAAPADLGARSAMCEASLLAGLAISTTRTALAHSMSYPLTAHLGLPHGLACSFTLPAIVEFNAATEGPRMDAVAADAGCPGGASALFEAILRVLREVDAADLVRRHVPDRSSLVAHVGEMLTPGRADNNLRTADVDDARVLLDRSAELLELW